MVLKKETFTNMEDFIEKMTPIMEKSIWDFCAKGLGGGGGHHSSERIEEFRQIGLLSLVELYHKMMTGLNLTTGRVYIDVYHDLYTFVVSEFHVSIPRYMYSRKHNDFQAADTEEASEELSLRRVELCSDVEFCVDSDLFRSKLRKDERIVFDCLMSGIPKTMIANQFLHTSGADVTRIVGRLRDKCSRYFRNSDVLAHANG